MKPNSKILTINGGSSSLKFSLFDNLNESQILTGQIDRIGSEKSTFKIKSLNSKVSFSNQVDASTQSLAAGLLMTWIKAQGDDSVIAIGHRMVHGGPKYQNPHLLSPLIIQDLKKLMAFDPEHWPIEILLIDMFQNEFPNLPQVVCFDTCFHQSLPRIAQILPLPRRLENEGLKHYGFHGLSYEFIMQEILKMADLAISNSRLILAHLGSGASLAAVHDGQSLDTSMSFTPASGAPMGTRSGDLDPGLAWYLNQANGTTIQQYNTLVNFQSGLLGISETTSDMQELLKIENSDRRAAEAISFFCYQIKKWIGAYSASLSGLDTLVFTGGIGENSPIVRARICAGLEFLGIEIDAKENRGNAPIISTKQSRVFVRVIPTNEDQIIFRAVRKLLHLNQES